jgi:gamma-D-glutamyl-L-lysine dipeptidyl-peptidase
MTDIRIVATTLTDLRVSPSFLVERATQVTNGTELEVLKSEGEWCQVRQQDGYEGWAYAAFLADASTRRGGSSTHIVSEPTVLLLPEPGATTAHPASRLPIGMPVVVAEHRGNCARIEFAAGTTPGGWAKLIELRPLASLPLPADKARDQIVADARRLTGVYYLWGGTTAWGIDCSGLAQLCYRLAGYMLLRDARMQFTQGKVIQPPFRPGDLLFFHGESDKTKITHVGISTGGWHIIHSSRSKNGVYEEDLEGDASSNLRSRFAGARSFLD